MQTKARRSNARLKLFVAIVSLILFVLHITVFTDLYIDAIKMALLNGEQSFVTSAEGSILMFTIIPMLLIALTLGFGFAAKIAYAKDSASKTAMFTQGLLVLSFLIFVPFIFAYTVVLVA